MLIDFIVNLVYYLQQVIMQLESNKIVIEAPMSFSGSAKRLWWVNDSIFYKPIALIMIPIVWSLVFAWYLVFGFLVIPYRLLRHKEIIDHTSY
jgi:hypothetical protein